MYQTFASLLSKILALIITILSTSIAAHYCGPAKFGQITVALTIQFVICEVVDFGHSTQNARKVASENYSGHWEEELPYLAIKSLIAAIIFIFVVNVFLPDLHILLVGILFNIPFWLINVYYLQIAYMTGKVEEANRMLLLQSLGSLSIYVYIHSTTFTEVAFEMSILTGSIFMFSFVVFVSLKSKRRAPIEIRSQKFAVKKFLQNYRNEFAAPRIIGNLMTLDVMCINIIFGNQASGLYAASTRIRSILPLGIQTIADISMNSALRERNFRKILMRKEFIIIFVMTLFGFILLEIFTPFFISTVFGPKYIGIVFLTRIFILIALLSGILTVGRSLLIAQMLEAKVNRSYAAMFTILLPTFFVATHSYGLKGAAVSQLIFYVFITSYLWRQVYRFGIEV